MFWPRRMIRSTRGIRIQPCLKSQAAYNSLKMALATIAAAHGRPKIVMIVGTTGSGKSKLGIELAQQLGGEVVNADVIQMYAGLDVASAKVPLAERGGVLHHLMSFLDPRTTFSVRDFYHVAAALIDDIAARGRLPVVVGGTMYYCQSLLRDSLLEEDEQAVKLDSTDNFTSQATSTVNASASGTTTSGSLEQAEAPYDKLRRVDPVMAERLHPNDSRKIARALQVFDSTGVPYSEVLRRQQERLQSGAAADGSDTIAQGPATAGRYDVKMLCLHVADPAVHASRLDKRVDTMVTSGLVGEIQQLKAFLDAKQALINGADSSSSDASHSSGVQQQLSLTSDVPSGLTVRCVKDYLLSSRLQVENSSAASLLSPPFYWSPQETGQAPPLLQGEKSESVTIYNGSSSSAAMKPSADNAAESGSDYTGLLQAIGYKEFSDYLLLLDSKAALSSSSAFVSTYGATDTAPSSVNSQSGPRKKAKVAVDPLAAALAAGIEGVKQVTRRYAKKQDRWIRNRFEARGVPMTKLDSSDVSRWDDTVLQPALAGVRAWLASDGGASVTASSSSSASAAAAAAVSSDAARVFAWKKFTCDVCDRTVNGEKEWGDHLRSKAHDKSLRWMRERDRLQTEYGIVLPKEGRKGKKKGDVAAAAAADDDDDTSAAGPEA